MSEPLWGDERIVLHILAKGGGIKQMSIGQVAAQDIMKSMRDDYEAQRAASVPRRVDKVIRAGLRRERVNIEMSDLSPGHLASELADVDAAYAWIAQHVQE